MNTDTDQRGASDARPSKISHKQQSCQAYGGGATTAAAATAAAEAASSLTTTDAVTSAASTAGRVQGQVAAVTVLPWGCR